MIYEVCCKDSDIDATIMMLAGGDDEQTPAQRLELVARKFKAHDLNCESRTGAKHPILVVQKDPAKRVPFSVDISFEGHEAIHKSFEVKLRFERFEGRKAFDLAMLVKRWASNVKLKGGGCWTSHGWMLLVIMYMSNATRSSSPQGFFEWFLKTFPRSLSWEIGVGKAPVEFEPDNVALYARLQSDKLKIHDKVKEAIEKMKTGTLPW